MHQLSKVDMLAFILQLPTHTKFTLDVEVHYDKYIEFINTQPTNRASGRPTCSITISLDTPADPKLIKTLGIK